MLHQLWRRALQMCYTGFMKIYSLQEENEKMNAARKLAVPPAPQKNTARMPAAPQKNAPQNRKRASHIGLIIWLLIMLLIFGGNILAQLFNDL